MSTTTFPRRLEAIAAWNRRAARAPSGQTEGVWQTTTIRTGEPDLVQWRAWSRERGECGMYATEADAWATLRAPDVSLASNRAPTHRCRVCNAMWIHYADGTWSLASKSCGPCCDNAAMGDQIEPLRLPGAGELEGKVKASFTADLPIADAILARLHPAHEGEEERLLEALSVVERAVAQFAFYRDEHLKKNTREGNVKAHVNAGWARDLEEAHVTLALAAQQTDAIPAPQSESSKA